MSTSYTPTNRVSGPKLRQRNYRTTCKKCGRGIFEGDRTVWLSSPLGLSHEECP